MQSSKLLLIVVSLACSTRALAQSPPQGFAVERFYPAAPGGGWFVMDDLDLRGGFGGAIALAAGYAHRPLTISGSGDKLRLVSDQAFADVGVAASYDSYRVYLNFTNPLVINGDSGMIGGLQLTGPSVDVGKVPDLISDVRVGFDARVFGEPSAPLRLGASVQLIAPNGSRQDYDTDGSFRAMIRALIAGDLGVVHYAGQLGVHIRPLDVAPLPSFPRGSELLFGAAAGAKLDVGSSARLIIGPELYGQSAFRSFFGSTSTGIEGLLTARLEGSGDGPQLRLKLGLGGGLHPDFGAPQWRTVLAIEVVDHKVLTPAKP
jgi:hypothetical protein